MRNIRNRLVSFLSLCAVVLLGVGSFFTTRYLAGGLSAAAAQYYDRLQFRDFELRCSVGITEEDLRSLTDTEQVTAAEGVISVAAALTRDRTRQTVQLLSLTERVSIPELLEGALPRAGNECALGADLMREYGIAVGDTVRLSASADASQALLRESEFLVTGKIWHPEYLRQSRTYYAVVALAAFDPAVTGGWYSAAFVRRAQPVGVDPFSDEYDAAVSDTLRALERLTGERSAERDRQLLQSGVDLIRAVMGAEAPESDAALLSDAREALSGLLRDAETAAARGDLMLDAVQAMLEWAGAHPEELPPGAEEALRLLAQLREQAQDYAGVVERAYRPVAEAQLSGADSAAAELALQQAMDDAWTGDPELPDAETVDRLMEAFQASPAGQAGSLRGARAALETYMVVASGQGIDGVRRSLEDYGRAKAALPLLRSAANALAPGRWVVLGRSANSGYVDLRSNLDAIGHAGIFFGTLFLLVSALVCGSTLTIMAEDQKEQIGALKALGFRGGEILKKYLLFSVSAAVAGVLLGTGFACLLALLMQGLYAGNGLYIFGRAGILVPPGLTAGVCLLAIALCAAVTALTCARLLKTPAALLLKGVTLARAGARRETKRRQRGGRSLYSGLILRNMRDGKARVLVSVAIIAGSCLIIGIGFTLKFSFDGMLRRQTDAVYVYDLRIDLGENVSAAQADAVDRVLTDSGADWAPALRETRLCQLGDRLEAAYVIRGDAELFKGFLRITDPDTGLPLQLPDSGVLIQSRMAETCGISAGAPVTLLDDALAPCTAQVSGVFQNYQGRMLLFSRSGYTGLFGQEGRDNCRYVSLNGADAARLEACLLAISEDLQLERADAFTVQYRSFTLIYRLVVVGMTLIAILMAFMILLNLVNILVRRRKAEVIILRINGFSYRASIASLIGETAVITLAGLAAGTVLGILSAPAVVRLMEQPDVQLIREISVPAWVLAVVIEAAFSAAVCFLAFRAARRFELTEIARQDE